MEILDLEKKRAEKEIKESDKLVDSMAIELADILSKYSKYLDITMLCGTSIMIIHMLIERIVAQLPEEEQKEFTKKMAIISENEATNWKSKS